MPMAIVASYPSSVVSCRSSYQVTTPSVNEKSSKKRIRNCPSRSLAIAGTYLFYLPIRWLSIALPSMLLLTAPDAALLHLP